MKLSLERIAEEHARINGRYGFEVTWQGQLYMVRKSDGERKLVEGRNLAYMRRTAEMLIRRREGGE